MTKSDWVDLTVLERRKYNLLSEVMDVSQQMGEALDRNDSVSVRILVAMRQDPLLQLGELKQNLDAKKESLTQEERDRLSALGREDVQPDGPEETAYFNQAGITRRLLTRVIELDERLSRRLGGANSFYARKK